MGAISSHSASQRHQRPPRRKGDSVCPEDSSLQFSQRPHTFQLAGALTRFERLLYLLIDWQRKTEHLLCSSPGPINGKYIHYPLTCVNKILWKCQFVILEFSLGKLTKQLAEIKSMQIKRCFPDLNTSGLLKDRGRIREYLSKYSRQEGQHKMIWRRS